MKKFNEILNLKWLMMLLLAMTTTIALTACSDDDNSGNGKSIVGTWIAVSSNGKQLPAGVSGTATFKSNGKGSQVAKLNGKTMTSYDFKWEAEDEMLTMTVTKVNAEVEAGDVEVGDVSTMYYRLHGKNYLYMYYSLRDYNDDEDGDSEQKEIWKRK